LREYWGVWGVEIFFVLSGYLIGGILINNLHERRLNSFGGIWNFWRRRWFRTLPNYYLFLLSALLDACLEDGHLPVGWEKYLWFGQALLSDHPGFFIISWSLAIEEWFYLLFPIILFILARVIHRRERACLAAIAVFLIAPAMIRLFLPPDALWVSGVRAITLARLDAIGYGVGLAFLKCHHVEIWNQIIRHWRLGAIAAAGVFAHACWHCIAHGSFTSELVFYRVFYFCFISGSLALLFPKILVLAPGEGWQAIIVRKLSLWSYSIYLSHVFLLGIIVAVFAHFGVHLRPGGMSLVARDLLTWITTIPFSAMVYKLYEKPMMDLRDRPLKTILRRPARARVEAI
jgi:peptidoglycan/LPS O-acetylase OafA/YrhL